MYLGYLCKDNSHGHLSNSYWDFCSRSLLPSMVFKTKSEAVEVIEKLFAGETVTINQHFGLSMEYSLKNF